jgi:predicted transposase YbfD/YdcC
MDQPQYSKLVDALASVPDPRHDRGKQLEWGFLLGLIATALLCQQRSAAAIAHWARSHATPLLAAFRPTRGRIPSESTIRRVLHQVDSRALEQQLAQLATVLPAADTTDGQLHGAAIDGKHVRGAGTRGNATLLVSLVCHTTAQILAQERVAQKCHESRAVPLLLRGRQLTGCVITMDAGLTHANLAKQIVEHGGHYLMVVKRNQHQLYEELTWFFDTPPLPCDVPWRDVVTVTKGHGRLETRRLTCSSDLDDYVRWPGVRQVLRRECERLVLKTGQLTRAVTYGLTSLSPADATVAELAALWRGHWTIENRVHYVRDVTMGEDGQAIHAGQAPQTLAALRNSLINLLRQAGWTNIAAALRYFNGSIRDALQFIGVPGL